MYSNVGPPFNFLGNMSESQKEAFTSWVNANTSQFPDIQVFHQIRAQQMRKTAGMLEKYYAGALAPTFIKETWTPAAEGHFSYVYRQDHEPAMVVGRIKEYFRPQLVAQDDAVFAMNQARTLIEKSEDLAQYASEASAKINQLMDSLEVLFGSPEYQAALVKDKSDLYRGEQRFRTFQLDPPTQWERDTGPGASIS